MVYLENTTNIQEVYIPRNDHSGTYLSPYDKGYEDGWDDAMDRCEEGQLESGYITVTADTQTVHPSSGYMGFDEVNIDATEYGRDKYDEGVQNGLADGKAQQKSLLASTAITENGEYYRENGWNTIEVHVPTGVSCTLQDKTVSMSGSYITVYADQGYDGLNSVGVNASPYGDSQYQNGFESGFTSGFSSGYTSGRTDGCDECYAEGFESGFTSGFSSGYTSGRTDGCEECYQSGYESGSTDGYNQGYESGSTDGYNSGYTSGVTDGYSSGYTSGVSDTQALMTSTAFTQNDTYQNPSGWSSVTVNVPKNANLGTLVDAPAMQELNNGYYDKSFVPSEGSSDGWGRVYLDLNYIIEGGKDEQKALLSSTAFTHNGEYTNASGWSAVTVQVPTGVTCNLQDKTVSMTATTQTFVPDNDPITKYIGLSSATYSNSDYYIDTGIYPTTGTTMRIIYKGRGCNSECLVGVPFDYRSTTDNTDWRLFDTVGEMLDFNRSRLSNSKRIISADTKYDFTIYNNYLVNNITQTTELSGTVQSSVDSPDTICVDGGSVWVHRVIIETDGVVVFDGIADEINGEVGLYDSITEQLFNRSGVTFVLHQEGTGADYDGMSAITVNASALCQNYYDSGYTSGVTDGYSSGYTSGYTSGVTDGCNECYQDGYNEGYNEGVQHFGTEIIVASSVTVSSYGTYYFVYDSATSVSAMTVHFLQPISGTIEGSIRYGLYWSGTTSQPTGFTNFQLYNTQANISTLDRIEIDNVVWTGGTYFTGDAHQIVYYFNGPIPANMFLGCTTPTRSAFMNFSSMEIGANAFKNVVGLGDVHITIDGECQIDTGAFDGSSITGLQFLKVHGENGGYRFQTNSIVNNTNLGSLFFGERVIIADADSTLFYGSSNNGLIKNYSNVDVQNSSWYQNNLNGWTIEP